MTKKEFLAMSLPHELRYKDTFRNSIHLLTGIVTDNNESYYQGGVYSHGLYMSWINCTPILHPLSDLTKEIENNGEKFVPCEKFGLAASIEHEVFLTSKIKNGYMSIREFMCLVELHFDVAGLIEKGEAIDVNTLEVNPYK